MGQVAAPLKLKTLNDSPYLMNITHALQIPADSLLVDTVLDSKLLQCLLALYIVGNYLILVPTSTAQKLSPTVFAFIQLFSAF